jgi:hypothetical protein
MQNLVRGKTWDQKACQQIHVMRTSATDAAGANTTVHAIALRSYGLRSVHDNWCLVTLFPPSFVTLFADFTRCIKKPNKKSQKCFFRGFFFPAKPLSPKE